MNTTNDPNDIRVYLAYENGEEIRVVIDENTKQYTIREFIDSIIAHLNEGIPKEDEKIKTQNLYDEEGNPKSYFVTKQRGDEEAVILKEKNDDGQIKHIGDFDFKEGDHIKLQYQILPG